MLGVLPRAVVGEERGAGWSFLSRSVIVLDEEDLAWRRQGGHPPYPVLSAGFRCSLSPDEVRQPSAVVIDLSSHWPVDFLPEILMVSGGTFAYYSCCTICVY